MDYLSAYQLCFLELSFIAFLLLILHGLRNVLGITPFFLALGTALIFSQIITAADLRLIIAFEGLNINVGSGILFTPFMMALLIVYALDGTIAAQRMTIGIIAISASYYYLAHITAKQVVWDGYFVSSPEFANFLIELFTRNNTELVASMSALAIDLLVLPVIFQLFRNRNCSIVISVLASLIFTQVVDTFIFSMISAAFQDDMWKIMRNLYMSRCIASIWLGLLASGYLKISGYGKEVSSERNPLDYIKAILMTSYTPGSLLQKHAHEWEGRFKIVVENSRDMIFMISSDGQIIDANKISINSTGYSLDELRKMNIDDLVIKKDDEIKIPEAFKDVLQKTVHWNELWEQLMLDSERTVQHEWLIKAKEKEQVENLGFYSVGIELGRSKSAILIGRNITSRKLLENEKMELMDQLAHSQRLESVGRLAGGIAHDFNNLLHSVQGGVDSLTSDIPASNKEEIYANISRAVERASSLTDQLLGFAKKGKYVVRKAELSKILDTSVNLFEPISRQNVVVKMIQHPTPLVAKVDATQLEQVLLNMLINAMDAGGTKIVLRTEPAFSHTPGWNLAEENLIPENFACIRIKDNGSGISEDLLATIFDPFFTTKGVGKGTGMGLAMAYGCISNHNGWIHTESKLNKGTEFFIFLPKAE